VSAALYLGHRLVKNRLFQTWRRTQRGKIIAGPVMRRLAVLRNRTTPEPWHQIQTALFVGLVALELDQLSKLWVRETMELGKSIPHEGHLRITHVVNPGIFFGTPASHTVSLFLPLGMILVSLGLYWILRRSKSTVLNIGTGLFIGGTLGNLLDRILQGHVTDFIEVVTSGGNVSTIFNLADLCVIAGIVLIEAFLIGHIVRLIMRRGLRYNPLKPALVRIIHRSDPNKKM
jgi:signal peptidase II